MRVYFWKEWRDDIASVPQTKKWQTKKTMTTTNFLATNKPGRVALHVFCILRRPAHAAWHWQGILREVGRSADRRVRASLSRKICADPVVRAPAAIACAA